MKPSDPSSDPTLLATQSDSAPKLPDDRPSLPDGYELGTLLGRGGMGEVMLANDPDIGREIALKRMRGGLGSTAEARFLREAKIQARLEHPAIVPVHELGRDAEGRPYFTMKRVTGTTLAELVATERLQRLLRAFVDVCLAIEFAHSRKIVHRDLKPANIMLGEFGEVYVLDWGIARVLGEDDVGPLDKVPTDSGETEAGSLLGTPGYMAPEQARGETVGPRADVYALGCILFEILVREPLHPRGAAAISHTLRAPTASPADKNPTTPVELAAICVDALAASPDDRPTARALADRIQQFLDGDRDLEARKSLSGKHLAIAQTTADDDRVSALQSAGRALALDPDSRDAAELFTRLALDPPAKHSPELLEHLAAVELETSRAQWKRALYAWLGFYTAIPILLVAGVKNYGEVTLFYVFVTIMVALCYYWQRHGRPRVFVAMVVGLAAIVALSRVVGPLVMVPSILTIVAYGFMTYPDNMRRPIKPIVTILGTFFVAVALEAIGIFPDTWNIVGDVIVIHSTIVDLGGLEGAILLVGTTAITILFACLFAYSLSRDRFDAQRRLEIQAWHLRKLVPA